MLYQLTKNKEDSDETFNENPIFLAISKRFNKPWGPQRKQVPGRWSQCLKKEETSVKWPQVWRVRFVLQSTFAEESNRSYTLSPNSASLLLKQRERMKAACFFSQSKKSTPAVLWWETEDGLHWTWQQNKKYGLENQGLGWTVLIKVHLKNIALSCEVVILCDIIIYPYHWHILNVQIKKHL